MWVGYGLAAAESRQMLAEQRGIDGGQLVVAQPASLVRRQRDPIELVGAEIQHSTAEVVHEPADDRALAGGGSRFG